jgi:glutathione synthase/RimK-type ligase-like ATP-grasp enzyme
MVGARDDKDVFSNTLLLVATENWPTPGHIARHLKRAGFAIAVLSPRHSPLRFSAGVSRWFPLSSLLPRAGLLRAIEACRPLAIVPCDDDALAHLHALHSRAVTGGTPSQTAVAARIERSLGDPGSFALVRTKSAVAEVAQRLGIAVPRCDIVRSREELLRFEGDRFPKVLKKDFTFGGRGVVIAGDFKSLMTGYAALGRKQKLSTALWDAYVDETLKPLVRRGAAIAPVTVVQEYMPGRPANTAVFAHRGEIIAAITVVARETHPGATGPATVAEIRKIPAMEEAARLLCRALKLSGFCGFDFVYDRDSGDSHFLEINARLTPTAHLGRDVKTNLVGAAARQLLDRSAELSSNPDPPVVALFPQEWLRDPSNLYLQEAYHDVPWDDPPAFQAMVRWALRIRRTERLLQQIKRMRRVLSPVARLRPVGSP